MLLRICDSPGRGGSGNRRDRSRRAAMFRLSPTAGKLAGLFDGEAAQLDGHRAGRGKRILGCHRAAAGKRRGGYVSRGVDRGCPFEPRSARPDRCNEEAKVCFSAGDSRNLAIQVFERHINLIPPCAVG